MGTKRYFYTDPLAAAWMAKHFGMRLTDCRGLEVRGAGVSFDFSAVNEYRPDGITLLGVTIHPDSLHLLMPHRGDICEIDAETDRIGDYRAIFIYPPMAVNPNRLHPKVRIVQRDGKAFHWPESEAA